MLGVGDGFTKFDIEEFAVRQRRKRIGEAFGAHDLEILLKLFGLLARHGEPRFELLVAELHLLGAGH